MSKSLPDDITISNFPHRFFEPSNVICGLSFKVPISNNYLKSKYILNKFSIKNDIKHKYVLCPIYGKKQNDKIIPTSIQIGVTGKAKQIEPIKFTVNRELGEKLRLIVPHDNLDGFINHDISNPSLFTVLIKNMICINSDIENNIGWFGDYDEYRKIGVCAIGTKDEIMNIFSSSSFGCRYFYTNEDIIGVVSIPISLALNQIDNK